MTKKKANTNKANNNTKEAKPKIVAFSTEEWRTHLQNKTIPTPLSSTTDKSWQNLFQLFLLAKNENEKNMNEEIVRILIENAPFALLANVIVADANAFPLNSILYLHAKARSTTNKGNNKFNPTDKLIVKFLRFIIDNAASSTVEFDTIQKVVQLVPTCESKFQTVNLANAKLVSEAMDALGTIVAKYKSQILSNAIDALATLVTFVKSEATRSLKMVPIWYQSCCVGATATDSKDFMIPLLQYLHRGLQNKVVTSKDQAMVNTWIPMVMDSFSASSKTAAIGLRVLSMMCTVSPKIDITPAVIDAMYNAACSDSNLNIFVEQEEPLEEDVEDEEDISEDQNVAFVHMKPFIENKAFEQQFNKYFVQAMTKPKNAAELALVCDVVCNVESYAKYADDLVRNYLDSKFETTLTRSEQFKHVNVLVADDHVNDKALAAAYVKHSIDSFATTCNAQRCDAINMWLFLKEKDSAPFIRQMIELVMNRIKTSDDITAQDVDFFNYVESHDDLTELGADTIVLSAYDYFISKYTNAPLTPFAKQETEQTDEQVNDEEEKEEEFVDEYMFIEIVSQFLSSVSQKVLDQCVPGMFTIAMKYIVEYQTVENPEYENFFEMVREIVQNFHADSEVVTKHVIKPFIQNAMVPMFKGLMEDFESFSGDICTILCEITIHLFDVAAEEMKPYVSQLVQLAAKAARKHDYFPSLAHTACFALYRQNELDYNQVKPLLLPLNEAARETNMDFCYACLHSRFPHSLQKQYAKCLPFIANSMMEEHDDKDAANDDASQGSESSSDNDQGSDDDEFDTENIQDICDSVILLSTCAYVKYNPKSLDKQLLHILFFAGKDAFPEEKAAVCDALWVAQKKYKQKKWHDLLLPFAALLEHYQRQCYLFSNGYSAQLPFSNVKFEFCK